MQRVRTQIIAAYAFMQICVLVGVAFADPRLEGVAVRL